MREELARAPGSGPAVEQEPVYDFLENDVGDLMLVIDARYADPIDPVLVYCGEGQAWLVRSPDLVVHLDDMHPDVHGALMRVERISVAEMLDDDIIRGYGAIVERRESFDPILGAAGNG